MKRYKYCAFDSFLKQYASVFDESSALLLGITFIWLAEL